jgi:hypothetical protein
VAGGEEEEKKYQRGRGLRRLLGEEIDLGFQFLLLSNLFFSFLFFCFLIAFLKIFLYAPSLCVFFQPSLNHWTFVLSLLLYPLIISMSSKYLSHWSIFTGDLPTHTQSGLFSRATVPRTLTQSGLFSRATFPHILTVVYFHGRPAHTHTGLFSRATCPHILTLVYFQGRPTLLIGFT